MIQSLFCSVAQPLASSIRYDNPAPALLLVRGTDCNKKRPENMRSLTHACAYLSVISFHCVFQICLSYPLVPLFFRVTPAAQPHQLPAIPSILYKIVSYVALLCWYILHIIPTHTDISHPRTRENLGYIGYYMAIQ